MIRTFRHKSLAELFLSGASRGVRPDLVSRTLRRLDALHRARSLDDLRLPGFGFHRLHGAPVRYAIAVNGPWRITFEWLNGDACRVGLEQYH
jgi:proteic killer suppression protein